MAEREVAIDRPTTLEMATRILRLGLGVLQRLIVLRIVLLLLLANRENDIAQLVRGVSGVCVAPFRDMFALSQISRSGSVFDIAAVVARIGWTIVELLLLAVLNLGGRRTRTEAD